MKNKETILTEIKTYLSSLRKNRGEVLEIELISYKDYVPNTIVERDEVAGAWVTFENSEKLFLYRQENKVNNFENGKGYGFFNYRTYKQLKKVIESITNRNNNTVYKYVVNKNNGMFIRSEFQKLSTLPEGYTESKEELIVDHSSMLEEGFIERVTA
jgi:hypothetical protein